MKDSTVVNPLTGNMQGDCNVCGEPAPVYVNGIWVCYEHSAYAEVDKLRAEATATGPERDLAEQALAALETLAIVGACGRLYLSDEGEPLDMCSVTCDVLKGKYRYWFADTNQTARDEDGGLVTRAEALERLREKGAKA